MNNPRFRKMPNGGYIAQNTQKTKKKMLVSDRRAAGGFRGCGRARNRLTFFLV
jgi:hypothetical protein